MFLYYLCCSEIIEILHRVLPFWSLQKLFICGRSFPCLMSKVLTACRSTLNHKIRDFGTMGKSSRKREHRKRNRKHNNVSPSPSSVRLNLIDPGLNWQSTKKRKRKQWCNANRKCNSELPYIYNSINLNLINPINQASKEHTVEWVDGEIQYSLLSINQI